MSTNKNIKTTPFLRWIGGKTKSVNTLLKYCPNLEEVNEYWEPFVGAGSLYFALQPRKATISDKNSDLIWCYQVIRDHPKLINRYLIELKKNHNKKYYYFIREKFNNSKKSISRAAMFIYLNKTCFNGIWRVNTSGEFNVPYGEKDKPSIFDLPEILNYSRILQNTMIYSGDYKEVLKGVKPNDFVYLDPPYPPISKTSNFNHYTKDRFVYSDQKQLAAYVSELHMKGSKFLLSNASTEIIKKEYKGFQITDLEVTRWVRSDGKRYKAKELIIKNY